MLGWKDKETTSDGQTFRISHQEISCITLKVRFQRMDSTRASFFNENHIFFIVAYSSSFARMIEESMRFAIIGGCLVQVGNGIELDTVGRQFEPYRRHPCGVTWDVVPEQSW